MEIRPYDQARDLQAVRRIWREIGWLHSEFSAKRLTDFLGIGRCLTAALDGEAECIVHTTPGAMRYQDTDAPMCAVTAVTTSRVARKLGLAQTLTARQLAAGALDGAEVAVLGMFDQGFYDRMGFGTGAYQHTFKFDPATLAIDASFRPPKRLRGQDWRKVHAAMLARRRLHGGCLLHPPEITRLDMDWCPNGFGLGYEENGALTHFLWLFAEEVEHGPYTVQLLAYQTPAQLLELLALLKSLGDQISLVIMREPGDIQLQSLLRQPFRHRRNTRKGEFAAVHQSAAWWQLRMLDLSGCVARRRWSGMPVRFNLTLNDPLASLLDDGDGAWRGCGGDYQVSIAAESAAEPGHAAGLPTLTASVNAFSRLWWGVAPASSLAITDALRSDRPELLGQLDEALRLPTPHIGWEF